MGMTGLSAFNVKFFLQYAILIVAVGVVMLAVCRHLVPRWAANITRDLGPILIVLVILALLLGALFELLRIQFGAENGPNGENGTNGSEVIVGPTTMIGQSASQPLMIRMEGSARSVVRIDGGYHWQDVLLLATEWSQQLHDTFSSKPWSEVLPPELRYARFEYDRFVPEGARLAMITALEQSGFKVSEKRIER